MSKKYKFERVDHNAHLNAFWGTPKAFGWFIDSHTACRLLSELMQKDNRFGSGDLKNKEGWFFVTTRDLEFSTAMTYTQIQAARNELERLGILGFMRKGVPPKVHYVLNGAMINLILKNINYGETIQACEDGELSMKAYKKSILRRTSKLILRSSSKLIFRRWLKSIYTNKSLTKKSLTKKSLYQTDKSALPTCSASASNDNQDILIGIKRTRTIPPIIKRKRKYPPKKKQTPPTDIKNQKNQKNYKPVHYRLAKRLARIVRKHYLENKNQTIKQTEHSHLEKWAIQFRLLEERGSTGNLKGSTYIAAPPQKIENIERVLEKYSEEIGGQGNFQGFCGTTFRAKFIGIESYNAGGYTKPKKSKYGYRGKERVKLDKSKVEVL